MNTVTLNKAALTPHSLLSAAKWSIRGGGGFCIESRTTGLKKIFFFKNTKKILALFSGVFDSSISSVLEVCQSKDDRDDPVPLTLFHYEFGGGLPALGSFGGMLCSLEEERVT